MTEFSFSHTCSSKMTRAGSFNELWECRSVATVVGMNDDREPLDSHTVDFNHVNTGLFVS